MNYRVKQLLEHLIGPAGSVLFHVLLILLLVKLAMLSGGTQMAPSINVDIAQQTPDTEETPAPPDPRDDVPPMPEDPGNVSPDARVTVDPGQTRGPAATTTSAFGAPNAPDVPGLKSDVQTKLVFKGIYASRTRQGISQAGGRVFKSTGVQIDDAVMKALRWLQKNQEANGAWVHPSGTAHTPGTTGLALLAFLAHGETPDSKEFGDTVRKGLDFLLALQQPNGAFTHNPNTSTVNYYNVYAHAMATYAVSEACGLTRITKLKDSMDRAVAVIVADQAADGSWTYTPGKCDTSVTCWMIQALKAAKLSNCSTPGLERTLEKAEKYLQGMFNSKTSEFAYRLTEKGGLQPGMATTAGSVLCMQLLGRGEAGTTRAGLKYISDYRCEWGQPLTSLPKAPVPDRPFYLWYYVTQAKYQESVSSFENWNRYMAKMLADRQKSDGSWISPGTAEAKDGAVLGTCFGTLILEVPYRFLPTYKKIDEPAGKPKAKEQDIEVSAT